MLGDEHTESEDKLFDFEEYKKENIFVFRFLR